MDIRLPIGLMFSAVGLLLAAVGAFSNREIYRASLGINVNLQWGLVLLVFGLIMLYFGRKAATGQEQPKEAARAKRSNA